MALLSFKWLVPALASLFHPFYVSVTEITHNARGGGYEVSCKVFAEDLEDELQKTSKTTIDLDATAQHAANDKLVETYMRSHLAISADGKALPLHYLGFEVDKQALYCYFDAPAAAAPHRISVSNSILQEFIDKQINIVHAIVGGKRQSTKLDYPEKSASFSF